ncbi:hypothetical protein Tco_0455328 [Tanacetum coccineum]
MFQLDRFLIQEEPYQSKTDADVKVAIEEMAEYSQKWHNGTSRTRSTETSDGLAAIQAQLNNLGREIKKVNEKVYAAQVGCEQCKGPHYTKDCPLKEEGKTLEEAYYTQFGAPFQGGGYRATTPGFYQRNNANPSYQERRQSMEETLSKFMNAAIRNQGASIKTLEIQIWQISKVLQERGFGSLPSSTKTNPRDHVKLISTIVEADSYPIRRMGSSQYAKGERPREFHFTLLYVMPLSTYLNLGLGKLAHTKLSVELADRTVKYPKGIDENVLVVDDLMPTIKEGEVIEEIRARNDDRMVSKVFGYSSDCDHDKKILIDYAYNLKFSCMIDFAVLEDKDAYRDEGMGDVIFGEPFLREVGINAKWFKEMITIHNGALWVVSATHPDRDN